MPRPNGRDRPVTALRRRDAGGGSTPVVSVVVIFKDAEDFLEEAVESVFAQSFDAWELLLVDDGSADRGTAIARRYTAENGGRVRYLEHRGHANHGMSASRNLGIARAAGEFIAFLDADDALVPGALAEQVSILRAHARVGMVYGPLEYWHGWTGRREDEQRDFVHPVGVPTDRIYEPPDLIALFIQNIAFAPSGMLLRRELVERVGGFDESFRDLYEDQVFAAKICRTTPVYISGRCWYRYRQHDRSCCLVAQRDGRLDASRRPFLKWLVAYLEREGLAGSEAWRLAIGELRRWSPRGRLVASLGRTRRLARQLATRFGGGTLG
jgi:glycosyltransferase involved in cell wall biosynthesis